MENVTFVEEKNDLRLCEHRRGADGTPELIAILQSVDS